MQEIWNGDKTDNRLDNLEWSTASENGLHAYAKGLSKPRQGVDCSFAVIDEQQLWRVRGMLEKGMSQRKVADVVGLSQRGVGFIANMTNWKHIPWPNQHLVRRRKA